MRGFIIFAFAIAILYGISSSFAAEGRDSSPPLIPTPLKVMPSKIKPVQAGNADELSRAAPEQDDPQPMDAKSLERLSPRPAFGFQNDFWKGITRQELVAFLSKPSFATKSKSIRDLTLKATLTASSDLAPAKTPEDNIYALRLEKLVNLGSFEDAQKLYKLNESSPPTPLAAQSAIESSLGNGEIAVACLDEKTFDSNLKTQSPSFWNNLGIFCQALLGPVAGDDESLRLQNASHAYLEIVKSSVAALTDVNKMDLLSTIALMKSGKLAPLLNTDDSIAIAEVDDKHLAVLMHYANPSIENIPLLAESIRRGLIDNTKAFDFLKGINLIDISNPYQAFLKEYFKTPNSPLVTDDLLSLTTNPIQEILLYPLYTAPETSIPNKHQRLSLRILALTNQDLPFPLVSAAYHETSAASFSSIESDKKQLSSAPSSGEELLIKLLLEKSKTDPVSSPPNARATLLALNQANYPQKDIKNSYDNVLSLTEGDNYVMPMGDILSNLKKFANQKQVNQVVIRSLAIIDGKPLEQLHPAALYRILEALSSAGLNEETMALTREVLGYQIKN